MLSKFDWILRCRTGAELLATINYFKQNQSFSTDGAFADGPFSASQGACRRCYVYAPMKSDRKYFRFCPLCQSVLNDAYRLQRKTLNAMIIWGYVNQVPRRIYEYRASKYLYGVYIHDRQRFLVLLHRQHLKFLLSELVMYHGTDLQGLLQIFPALDKPQILSMGDYLTWAIHHESVLLHDQLWIRFYDLAKQLINPKYEEKKGMLTFTVSEFLRLLDMAEIFRVNLRPGEQQNLLELLKLKDPNEEQFYWGRFLGQLNQEAKDMLRAWKIRQWSENQITLLYKLIHYVQTSTATELIRN
ncbi:hypothetical protein JXJ21_21595 [candidate division KSB1 bacterium]|nr:hypothetical protein [candidate division KSB1 bacterium]